MKKLSDCARNNILALMGAVLLVLSACIVVVCLNRMNFQPSGNDIWSHLYKGDIAYHNFQEGKIYQLYSEYWYNGTQLSQTSGVCIGGCPSVVFSAGKYPGVFL